MTSIKKSRKQKHTENTSVEKDFVNEELESVRADKNDEVLQNEGNKKLEKNSKEKVTKKKTKKTHPLKDIKRRHTTKNIDKQNIAKTEEDENKISTESRGIESQNVDNAQMIVDDIPTQNEFTSNEDGIEKENLVGQNLKDIQTEVAEIMSNIESEACNATLLMFHKQIKEFKESKLYKKLVTLKPTKIAVSFKLHCKIVNDEIFTACDSFEECERETKHAEELAQEAEQKVKKQKSRKSRILSLVFLLINIACIIVAVTLSASKEEGMVSIGEMFTVANLWYLLCAFLAFLLLMFFESLRYYILIWQSTRHSRPFLSYKVCATGKYFDNITPLASGGQPMQIYYLKKRGVKASTASSMPFAIFIFNQLLMFIVSLSVLIFSKKIAGGLDPTVFTMAIIGMSVNFAIMLFVFTLSFSKKVGPIVVIWVLKLLYKMHIIKDYTALFRKVMRFVSEYQKTFRYFVSNVRNFILMMMSTLCVLCTRYLIPAFIVCMFSDKGLDFETYSAVFIWCVLIESVLSYIPWPGAGGVAEVTYVTMFAYFSLSTGTTVWAMLIYRIFQYYIYLLQGLGVLCYDFFWGDKKIQRVNDRIRKIDEERKTKSLKA